MQGKKLGLKWPLLASTGMDSENSEKEPTYRYGTDDASDGICAGTRSICQTPVGRLCSNRNYLGTVCISWVMVVTFTCLEGDCLVAYANAAGVPVVA